MIELLGRLDVGVGRRQRILAEVVDHLTRIVADLHADGLPLREAEREAVRRFGPAPDSPAASSSRKRRSPRGARRAPRCC